VTTVGWLVVLGLGGAAGLALAASGWLQPVPPLERVLVHLGRPGDDAATRQASRTGRAMAALAGRFAPVLPSRAQLLLAGRTPERHVGYLVMAALGGLVGLPLLVAVLQAVGVLDLRWYVPAVAALAAAAVAPLLVHTALLERAADERTNLRFQVSAYLDVVTMLLAGNTGYEGALEQAARAGDGRLFGELRRRMREAGARGASLTEALERTGVELGLAELEQIAATAALSAAEGAPVARTLAAKCATLRHALAAEQESEARLRTSRLTTPIVGMALIFMALVIYPALSFST
jgi:Flp pilus assembly protein TadB